MTTATATRTADDTIDATPANDLTLSQAAKLANLRQQVRAFRRGLRAMLFTLPERAAGELRDCDTYAGEIGAALDNARLTFVDAAD